MSVKQPLDNAHAQTRSDPNSQESREPYLMPKVHGVRRYLAAAVALLCIAAWILVIRVPPLEVEGDIDYPSDAASIERGKYLADAGNCFSCHTREDGKPFAGGVAFETPFGRIYSSNITPDVETGIGSWNGNEFRRAMHEGVAADGSRLFSAFPYTSYTRITDADVAAIYAYLRSLEPVRYIPPDNAWPFGQRWALGIWNAAFFDRGRFVPDEEQSAEWNRGAYLVEALGHCGACHTPRGRLMAEVGERALEGGVIYQKGTDGKVREWFAANLTSAHNGLGSWSVDDLAQYFQKGFSPRAGTFGPMNEVVVNSLMKLTPEDAKAMAVYLTSLPGREYKGESVSPEQARAGAQIYEDRCEECHSASGRGGIFSGPPLQGSAIVQAENPASLINSIVFGPEIPDEIGFGAWETMQGYGDVLDDAEIAAVSNYIRGSWGNVASPISAEDVARQR
jgi:mono/diheme cytochrome c family protein